MQINISPIDNRHNFIPCASELIGEVIGDTLKKNTAVKITCTDPKPWTTYVRAQVKILIPRVMTSTSLIKGNRLTADNIKLSYVTKYQAKNGSFDELSVLIGTRLKRNLSNEKIITERDVCFVCKDDKVVIKANNKGLLIKTSGIALNDANIGGTVRVKNSRTQRIVVGTVSGLKEVQVSF
ncbi:flagellar basal body P-ring formation chaperone FlgA [Psychromonas sp. MME1]|uniref:flagellar basal body P-ring formation chaperone FlgA n=1 Tax=Psychromonas sp. MME1 TaxID=3231032 RepID=UPI0034E1A2BD